jgi:hypothetical protein
MVGPGTGIAPFRAFLQDRQAQGAGGANWLFFGEQHAASDFYYHDEIEAWHRDGHLDRLSLAFSRDTAQKVYVQHRMIEEGAQLWRWLADGAHFYVCGDAPHGPRRRHRPPPHHRRPRQHDRKRRPRFCDRHAKRQAVRPGRLLRPIRPE